jgi:hypothetical protein
MPRSNNSKQTGKRKTVGKAISVPDLPQPQYQITVQLRGSFTATVPAKDYPTIEQAIEAVRVKSQQTLQDSGLLTWNPEKPSVILWDTSEFTVDFINEQ